MNWFERFLLVTIVTVVVGIGVRVAVEAVRPPTVRCSPCSDDRWSP